MRYRPQAESDRPCEAAGCAESGCFPAPWSRHELRRRRWFCLDHVRLYNAAWDYLEGLDAAAIEALVRNDACWQQPTWPLGGGGQGRDGLGRDGLGQENLLRDAAMRARFGFAAGDAPPPGPEPRPGEEERWAAATLELAPRSDFATAKRRYKELVKRLHPDLNGDAPEAEEQLKRVNRAYAILKAIHLGARSPA